MTELPEKSWTVGFLYRLTNVGVLLLAIVAPFWWLFSLFVGIVSALSTASDTSERMLVAVAVAGAAIGFHLLVGMAFLKWGGWDRVERFAAVVAVLMAVGWSIWFADWDRLGSEVETHLAKWSVDWAMATRVVLGASIAIILSLIGRLVGYGVACIWRLFFWLVTGERLNSSRAFALDG